MMRSLLPATTAPTISTMAMTEMSGMVSATWSMRWPRMALMMRPTMMGSTTTCTTDRNMPEASTCSHCEANSQNTSGVSSGASSVATVVQATDSAVLPRAR